MPDPVVDGDKSAWANGKKSVDLFEIKMMNSSRYHPLKEGQGGKYFHFGSFFVYKKREGRRGLGSHKPSQCFATSLKGH